jgi:hypothetical protein
MATTISTKKIFLNFLFVVFVLFLNTSTIIGQTSSHSEHDSCKKPFELTQTDYKIGIGSDINFEISNPHNLDVSWVLTGNSISKKSGYGNQTGTILFDKPGKYELTYSSSAKDKFIAHSEKAIIEVLPSSFKFDIKNAKFSKPISQGNSVEGITLTIPVEIKSYNSEKVKFGPFKNSATGIDGIEMIFENQIELSEGINQLTFKLQGTPYNSGPAQLGFFNTIGEGFFYNFIINK